MKKSFSQFIFIALASAFISSCQPGSNRSSKDDGSSEIQEVLQTSSYTYLKLDQKGEEVWIAVLRGDYQKGQKVYYEAGLEMKNFESSELGRTFEKIYFVDVISDKPIAKEMPEMPGGMGVTGTEPQKPLLTKMDIKIDQPEGGISIAVLYENRQQYSGKIVKVKGQVTKVNEGIMGRNWVHLQDGTADGDNFDLTVTTEDLPMVGEIITYSGTLNLNRDFGAGYTYDVILEEAVPVSVR